MAVLSKDLANHPQSVTYHFLSSTTELQKLRATVFFCSKIFESYWHSNNTFSIFCFLSDRKKAHQFVFPLFVYYTLTLG